MANVQFNETGHTSMLARVKAAKKFLDSLDIVDIPYEPHSDFVYDMLDKWDKYEEEKIFISAKQYFYIKDLYDKYC